VAREYLIGRQLRGNGNLESPPAMGSSADLLPESTEIARNRWTDSGTAEAPNPLQLRGSDASLRSAVSNSGAKGRRFKSCRARYKGPSV